MIHENFNIDENSNKKEVSTNVVNIYFDIEYNYDISNEILFEEPKIKLKKIITEENISKEHLNGKRYKRHRLF